MRLLATITPDQFAALAVGWATAVLTVLTWLLPRLATLKAQVEALALTHADTRTQVNANTRAIQEVALATPAAPSAPAAASTQGPTA